MAMKLAEWRRYRRSVPFVLLCLGLALPANAANAQGKASSLQQSWLDAPEVANHQQPYGQPAPIASKIAAEFPTWKTITLGTYESIGNLRQALEAAHCHIGHLAGEILGQPSFIVSKTEMEVDLVVLSATDIGLDSENPSIGEIYARAMELGLELSPAEVAPQLRLQYLHQPLGEFLHIAMEPIATSGGEYAAFIVGNGGAGLLLIAGDVRADLMMPAAVRFVFVRPR